MTIGEQIKGALASLVLALLPGVCPDLTASFADLGREVGPGVRIEPFFDEVSGRTITVSGNPETVRHQWIEVEHPQFDRFLRIEVSGETTDPWNALLHSPANPVPIRAGAWVLVSFHGRNSPGSKPDSAFFKGYLERNEPAWMSLAEVSGATSDDWSRHVGFGQVTEDLPAGAVRLSVHLGFGRQSIDLAGFTVAILDGSVDPMALPSSTLTYDGMADDAPWRAKAAAMIAANRMGRFAIQVTDPAGRPVEGASIEVELAKHAYAFGTFFSRLVLDDTPQAADYREWIQANFNHATTPLYWADWGWADPVRRSEYLRMAAWLQEIDLPARGHVLLYPGWTFAPAELRAMADSPEDFNARVVAHLEEIVPLMRARGIREYDVINELRELSDFTDIVGMDGVVGWFRKVRELDPGAVLYINENSILTDGGRNRAQQDHYFNLIRWLLEKGAPLDGIGMQGHSSEAATPPEVIWSILDRFAVFGLPIRITEYDLGTRDEGGQAAYDRDFTTAVFSHPATVGMTRWGFYEPQMWRPLGAMIRADGSLKPNGEAHRRLLFETWHTRGRGRSDENGEFACRAFFGSYRVRVGFEGADFESVVEFPLLPDADGNGLSTVVIPIGR